MYAIIMTEGDEIARGIFFEPYKGDLLKTDIILKMKEIDTEEVFYEDVPESSL